MKFFTPEEKSKLVFGAVGGTLITLLTTGLGFSIGQLVGASDAYTLADAKGCWEEWHSFHYMYHGHNKNMTEICGDLCTTVCESATTLLSDAISDYTIGFGVSAAVLTLASLSYFSYRYYSQNKADPELQELDEGSQVNYSNN